MSIFNHFQHLSLSRDQQYALSQLERFLHTTEKVFMLKGYAGSGKTTILKGLVEYLNTVEKDFALMAPTGRATKVLKDKTGKEASTIHKSIYSFEHLVELEEGESFIYCFETKENTVQGKIYIIDEASMVSDSNNHGEFFRFGSGFLLSDLIQSIGIEKTDLKVKLIFVGDPCQLPPIGENKSRVFDSAYLKEKFNLSSVETELKEIFRQGSKSGILNTASKLRKCITAGFYNDFNLKGNGIDIFNPTYDTFLRTWEEASSPKIIIASKNKTCLGINLRIREMIFGKRNLPIQKGDSVILGANNYKKGFLMANLLSWQRLKIT
jgi:ATP-dependent exoDNAse (exonuclease V) alpha subunit